MLTNRDRISIVCVGLIFIYLLTAIYFSGHDAFFKQMDEKLKNFVFSSYNQNDSLSFGFNNGTNSSIQQKSFGYVFMFLNGIPLFLSMDFKKDSKSTLEFAFIFLFIGSLILLGFSPLLFLIFFIWRIKKYSDLSKNSGNIKVNETPFDRIKVKSKLN